MRHLFELQQQNGIVMGKMFMLFSHQSCSNIVCFIASEMRQRLLSFILKSKNPFSLLFDESMENETVLILYVRALDPAGTFSGFMLLTCTSPLSVKLQTHGQSMTAVKDRSILASVDDGRQHPSLTAVNVSRHIVDCKAVCQTASRSA